MEALGHAVSPIIACSPFKHARVLLAVPGRGAHIFERIARPTGGLGMRSQGVWGDHSEHQIAGPVLSSPHHAPSRGSANAGGQPRARLERRLACVNDGIGESRRVFGREAKSSKADDGRPFTTHGAAGRSQV